MGPSPFSDGRREVAANTPPVQDASFNGAIAFQRWKGLNTGLGIETRQLLQWGHRLSAMEGSNRHRMPICQTHASMGPSPFSDGRHVDPLQPGRELAASMGPSPFSDGRITAFIQSINFPQASMGPSPFSDGRRATGRSWPASRQASMGPSPFSDGRTDANLTGVKLEGALQWGHRLSAMEGMWSQTLHQPLEKLQWGHRLSAMEGRPYDRGTTIHEKASMGPSPFSDGRFRHSELSERDCLASMGPSPFSDGRSYLPLNSASLCPNCAYFWSTVQYFSTSPCQSDQIAAVYGWFAARALR